MAEVRHGGGWVLGGVLLLPLCLHWTLFLGHLLLHQLRGKVLLILFFPLSLPLPVLGLLLLVVPRHCIVVGHWGGVAALLHAGGVAEGAVQHRQVGVSKGSLGRGLVISGCVGVISGYVGYFRVGGNILCRN